MSRRVRERLSSLEHDELCRKFRESGFVTRDYFATRPFPVPAGPVDREVLCWWCREVHLASEVESCMKLPRKNAAVAGSESSTLKSSDAGPLSPFSAILAWLSQTCFEDGTRRQTGRLTLSFESGMWGLSFVDTESQQYAFLEGRNLEEMLLIADDKLDKDMMPWRASKWAPKGKR